MLLLSGVVVVVVPRVVAVAAAAGGDGLLGVAGMDNIAVVLPYCTSSVTLTRFHSEEM